LQLQQTPARLREMQVDEVHPWNSFFHAIISPDPECTKAALVARLSGWAGGWQVGAV
jgi:hypothetical protein